jgi:hypothetical protein
MSDRSWRRYIEKRYRARKREEAKIGAPDVPPKDKDPLWVEYTDIWKEEDTHDTSTRT